MGIGTGLAVATIGGGIASSAIGAHAAGSAANAQVASADKAAQLQKQAADESLAFQKQQYQENVTRQAPWLTSGTAALSKLSDMPSFQAPGNDFTTDPGYQFRVSEGNKAIERSAAARGSVANPATQKALDRFNQDTASQEYGNIYARRFGEYNNTLSQLQSRAGIGQTTATNLGTAGQNTANSVSNTLMNSANQQGQDAQNAGAARASGYVGGANAITGGIGSTLGNIGQIYTLSQLLKSQKTPSFIPQYPGQEPTSYPG
jgi:hypothetical protein